jgi:hypothetical protein
MEPQSALALSEDTLRQHDEDRSITRADIATQHILRHSGENIERDVEDAAGRRTGHEGVEERIPT